MFTDRFVNRPVLSTVISLLILLLGLRAIKALDLRQYPKIENTVITVTTSYPGASAKLIQGFITTPLQTSIASAGGIDYLTSTSSQGSSEIQAHIKLNYSPDIAFTNVMSKVAEVRNQLPRESEAPTIVKSTGSKIALMYMAFSSKNMSFPQVSDYIDRVIKPKLQTLEGVSKVETFMKSFAMRIWLNPKRMAALNITPGDIAAAIQANNFQSAVGKTKGQYIAYNVNAATDAHSQKEFNNLVIKKTDNAIIRLRDVAKVELGSNFYDINIMFSDKPSVFIGLFNTPKSNPLDVINRVRNIMPSIKSGYPPGLTSTIVYDATQFIRASIKEVIHTIGEATLIVIFVIFLFLGSLRAVSIPVITIPLSLIGVCALMLALGYSINLLTLLALVLAIGLVVDDAIVVVENIHRHLEEGMPSKEAAIQGAREIAMPVIAMTITLAAVYLPIGFTSGLTGALFKEFAFTLACAVIISGVIALTLSPMMCSKLLTQESLQYKLTHYLDEKFERIKNFYQRRLHNSLNFRPATVIFAITVLVSCYFLYAGSQKELAPAEDQSILFVRGVAAPDANFDYFDAYSKEFLKTFNQIPELSDDFLLTNEQAVFGGLILKPWGERKRSQSEVKNDLQNKLGDIAGLQAFAFGMPALPVGFGDLGIQFAVGTTSDFKTLYRVSQKLVEAAQRSGVFMFVQSTLKFNNPEINLHINRDKAAQLGINMQDIGTALSSLFSGAYVTRFSMEGRSYQVRPEIQRQFRLNPEQLGSVYIKAANGDMIPLSTLITLSSSIQPTNLQQFQQLNTNIISAALSPGKTMDDGLSFLINEAHKILPAGFTYDFAGQSRQYIKEGSTLMLTFLFALIVIYLVLAAQFESFRDPFIIMISVPMSICGALIPLYLGLATINIYTQIGLITLIGLISKHGILMVEFANKLQVNEGLTPRQAIEKAASIRLRAVLMTTFSMIFGVLPLILATGAGAHSRFDIGLVIAVGMLVGTMFTLFVVPMVYTYLAHEHHTKVVKVGV